MSVKAIPEGFTTVTPTLILNDAAKAIELYKQAFGAKELYRMEAPGKKKIMHACIMIGNAKLFLADAGPKGEGCGSPSDSSFYLYLDDVDTVFKQAKKAGLEEQFAVQDMFWGDRMGCVNDHFGIKWTLATHVRDVSPQEMEEAKNKFCTAA